jgi:hypothetical protein
MVGGVFESDEFSPNFPQLGRKVKGRRFNTHYRENQMRDPRAKNPGVNAAISDPPPDMRLKPPMRGEVDKNDLGRNKQYKGQSYLPSWSRPIASRVLSHGDFSAKRRRNPNY